MNDAGKGMWSVPFNALAHARVVHIAALKDAMRVKAEPLSRRQQKLDGF
jgi:hypothetical protein